MRVAGAVMSPTKRSILSVGVALLAALAAAAGWLLLRLPAALPSGAPAVIAPDEHAQAIAALKPPKRVRPVIAVLGDSDGTETTDYLVPYSVLTQSDVADVVALATRPGPLTLMPALTIQPQATVADFDVRHPNGADYVIVPAMHNPDAPAALNWIKSQHVKGATIVGVCSGARVLSKAGLLAGRAATGHWYDLDELRKDNPTMRWVPDRRYVADRGVVTTTGVTASVPVSLALVEAIGGRARAAALAGALGVADWEAGHDSKAFGLDRGHVSTAVGNTLAFWRHQTLGVPVESGVDEIALAFTVDAFSRTYRSQAVTVSRDGRPLRTRRGLELLPDRSASTAPAGAMLTPVSGEQPTRALDAALAGIAGRYGPSTAAWVALQLEYPWLPTPP